MFADMNPNSSRASHGTSITRPIVPRTAREWLLAFKPTFTIELANGCSGYIPTPEQHKLGGYETWPARSSFLETGAAPKIQAALMSLFQQLR